MSLIDEYVENREKRAVNKLIRNQLIHGMKAEVIAKAADIPLSRVKAIENELKE